MAIGLEASAHIDARDAMVSLAVYYFVAEQLDQSAFAAFGAPVAVSGDGLNDGGSPAVLVGVDVLAVTGGPTAALVFARCRAAWAWRAVTDGRLIYGSDVDRALIKQRTKQMVRRTIGEPYVGKRLKLRRVGPAMRAVDLNPRVILDYGAEDATFVYWLADRYPDARVLAVDVDESAIGACSEARPARYAGRVQFRVATLADLEPESFDMVTAFDVLEHIPDDKGAAAHLYRALRPGGRLLVHVPRNQWTHADGRIEVVPDEEAWRINPGHVRSGYSPDGLRQLVESAGFVVLDLQLWLRRYAVIAHKLYARFEHPAPLRLLTIPATDVLSILDRRRPPEEGNSVWLVARKPA